MSKEIEFKYPKYVFFLNPDGTRNCAMRLVEDTYYRDAGQWFCNYRNDGKKIFAVLEDVESVHDRELVKCTKKEWKKDNKGYV